VAQIVGLLERCLRMLVTKANPSGYLQIIRYIFKVVIQVRG